MQRLIAMLALAALCGCGNSSRVVSRTETTTVTETTYMVGTCKKSCGSGKCMRVAEPAQTSAPVTVKSVDSGSASDFTPATVVELPPQDGAAVKSETPVPVSTTTTTRVVRWPRKLD